MHPSATPPSAMPAKVFTASLGRSVVATIAPDELPAFEMLSAPYLDGVDTSGSDGGLEFGVLDAVNTVTPVATVVCAAVTGAILNGMVGEVERSTGRVTRRVFQTLRRRKATVSLPESEWTREQLAELRAVAFQQATALGADEAAASAMADAVVGALVLAQKPQP